jgi:hypothetical protein
MNGQKMSIEHLALWKFADANVDHLHLQDLQGKW